ncbi:MAG: hypothetical protein HYS12_09505 [Planctomycetes bacterium]|nr:hypothetical protein [Planctomycetota bacterium]
MAKAVRFYWRGREAGIPLAEIPEQDRNPLRVRRSVVQAYAPDVVKQLEEDRFVAAAWESGEQISLILCHPNLANGPADTLLVNTTALPRVVVKLGGWDEIPEATKFLLTAFGSEAASVEECVAARRDLGNWLVEHGQPDVAAAVKHFSAFPFGVRSDALEVINTWRHVLVKGQKDQIDRFLDQVEQRFGTLGWSRDMAVEDQMNRGEFQQNRFYGWTGGPDSRPRALLCLNRATDRRIRGGTYKIDERAGLAELASVIQHVLREVLEPAAAAVGLEVSYPRLGPISRVGTRTEGVMTALAEAGDGQWPLPDEIEPVWRKFVLTAFREEVALKPEELTAWFIASGWEERASAELMKRFYRDVALIDEYQEAGRQPA